MLFDWVSWLLQSAILWQALLGSAVTAIAYRQWRNSREELKWKLYEKRLAVYTGIRKSMQPISANGTIDMPGIVEMLEATSHVPFLFGEDVQKFAKDLYDDANDLMCLTTELKEAQLNPEQRKQRSERRLKLMQKHLDRYKQLDTLFKRYIGFHTIR